MLLLIYRFLLYSSSIFLLNEHFKYNMIFYKYNSILYRTTLLTVYKHKKKHCFLFFNQKSGEIKHLFNHIIIRTKSLYKLINHE